MGYYPIDAWRKLSGMKRGDWREKAAAVYRDASYLEYIGQRVTIGVECLYLYILA